MKNTKKLLSLIFVLILVVMTAVTSLAAEDMPRLVDNAGLLSESEKAELLDKLDTISERQKADVVIVTVNSLGDKTPMEYADDFYDYNGYGYGTSHDGILLLISMADRDWWMTATGYGQIAFTKAGREYISEQFLPALSSGEYAEAFTVFAELCDDFFTQASKGEPYDTDNLPKEPFSIVINLIISLVIGFVIALIATGIMKGKLKSVRYQSAAGNYIKENSMRVTDSRELFLYTTITSTPKPKETSSSDSHTSSSGTSHSGSGGKF